VDRGEDEHPGAAVPLEDGRLRTDQTSAAAAQQSAAMEELSAASQALASMAAGMIRLADRFRVEDAAA
jgi:hypothetical protein